MGQFPSQWIELISLQIAPGEEETVLRLLTELARAINSGHEVRAMVYAKHPGTTELSMHLHHQARWVETPSAPGYQLASQLAEFGSVSHTVWLPQPT
ncbi:MAG: hypothetical protein KDI36_00150 [Pseudomonadales bacterium]|nr:hypothetical protein [Pseudomonadales bacterium]